MADETDKERADRLEQECEELTEQLHIVRKAVENCTAQIASALGLQVMARG